MKKVAVRTDYETEKDPTLDEIGTILDLYTHDMTLTVKQNDQGYIVDVYRTDGELYTTMTLWSDDLDLDDEDD